MVYNYTEYLKIPTKPRYGFVYHILGDFIDDIIDYPIDLTKLCKNNNWKLIEYTFFHSNLINISNDGFTILSNDDIYIFYNNMQPSERIKFTIAHEIGHITLGHHLLNGVLSHNGLIKNEAMEKEANVFARNLLAPAPLLCGLKLLPPIDVGASSFGVSKSFMEIRYKYLYDDYNSIKYNDKVMKKFDNYTSEINSYLEECTL